MNAVIDRIAEGVAVLLLGEKETEITIPVKELPAGVTEGTWLTVEFKIDKKTSADQYRKNRELLEKIKEKGKDKGERQG